MSSVGPAVPRLLGSIVVIGRCNTGETRLEGVRLRSEPGDFILQLRPLTRRLERHRRWPPSIPPTEATTPTASTEKAPTTTPRHAPATGPHAPSSGRSGSVWPRTISTWHHLPPSARAAICCLSPEDQSTNRARYGAPSQQSGSEHLQTSGALETGAICNTTRRCPCSSARIAAPAACPPART